MSGYVKWWRSVMESRHWPKPGEEYHPYHAWQWMVFKANYEPRLWNGIVIERGEFVTSEAQLAHKWSWSRSKVHRFLKGCERELEIELKSDKRWTRIRINNYEKYQGDNDNFEPRTEPQTNGNRITNDARSKKERTRRKDRDQEREKFLNE